MCVYEATVMYFMCMVVNFFRKFDIAGNFQKLSEFSGNIIYNKVRKPPSAVFVRTCLFLYDKTGSLKINDTSVVKKTWMTRSQTPLSLVDCLGAV